MIDVPRKPKAGQPCPTCADTLAGTLVPHCGFKPIENAKTLDDAMGPARGCKWLKCDECGHFGVPSTAGWVRLGLEGTL